MTNCVIVSPRCKELNITPSRIKGKIALARRKEEIKHSHKEHLAHLPLIFKDTTQVEVDAIL